MDDITQDGLFLFLSCAGASFQPTYAISIKKPEDKVIWPLAFVYLRHMHRQLYFAPAKQVPAGYFTQNIVRQELIDSWILIIYFIFLHTFLEATHPAKTKGKGRIYVVPEFSFYLLFIYFYIFLFLFLQSGVSAAPSLCWKLTFPEIRQAQCNFWWPATLMNWFLDIKWPTTSLCCKLAFP